MNIWVKSLIAGLVTGLFFFFFYENLTFQKRKHVYQFHCTVRIAEGDVSQEKREQTISTTIAVLQKRLKGIGSAVAVHRAGNTLLDIKIDDVADTSVIRETIEKKGNLEIREVYTLEQIAQPLSDIAQLHLPEMKIDSGKLVFDDNNVPTKAPQLFSVFSPYEVGGYAALGQVKKTDTAVLNKLLGDPRAINLLPDDLAFIYGPADQYGSRKKENDFLQLYAIRTYYTEASLRNNAIQSAAADRDIADNPQVTFRFNSVGSRIWEEMTTKNVNRPLAIIVDKKVISAPRVNEPISGGVASISGGFSMKEAELLASQLRSGYLPVALQVTTSEARTSQGAPGIQTKKMLFTALFILLSSALAFFIFKTLKNK